uniref:Uncharacterized protein n=1 Tax=Mycena chlorophos TaxID=658473 RepID=A0ABQ0KXF5_MYCCL|nr:predicted protein [Mycena chlorophos]
MPSKYTTEEERSAARRASRRKYNLSAHGREIRKESNAARSRRKLAKSWISRLKIPSAVDEFAAEPNFESQNAFEAAGEMFCTVYRRRGNFTPEFARELKYWFKFPFDLKNGSNGDGYEPDEMGNIVNAYLSRIDHDWRAGWSSRLTTVRSVRDKQDMAREEVRRLLRTWDDMWNQQHDYPPMTKKGRVFTSHLMSVARRIKYLTHMHRPENYLGIVPK